IRRLNSFALEYLSMRDRLECLATGEYQRIRLANLLSSALKGVLYILDEPSQGLHAKEIDLVLQAFTELKHQGATIVAVDHDERLIRNADFIIDMGPGGGREGGRIVAEFE